MSKRTSINPELPHFRRQEGLPHFRHLLGTLSSSVKQLPRLSLSMPPAVMVIIILFVYTTLKHDGHDT